MAAASRTRKRGKPSATIPDDGSNPPEANPADRDSPDARKAVEAFSRLLMSVDGSRTREARREAASQTLNPLGIAMVAMAASAEVKGGQLMPVNQDELSGKLEAMLNDTVGEAEAKALLSLAKRQGPVTCGGMARVIRFEHLSKKVSEKALREMLLHNGSLVVVPEINAMSPLYEQELGERLMHSTLPPDERFALLGRSVMTTAATEAIGPDGAVFFVNEFIDSVKSMVATFATGKWKPVIPGIQVPLGQDAYEVADDLHELFKTSAQAAHLIICEETNPMPGCVLVAQTEMRGPHAALIVCPRHAWETLYVLINSTCRDFGIIPQFLGASKEASAMRLSVIDPTTAFIRQVCAIRFPTRCFIMDRPNVCAFTPASVLFTALASMMFPSPSVKAVFDKATAWLTSERGAESPCFVVRARISNGTLFTLEGDQKKPKATPAGTFCAAIQGNEVCPGLLGAVYRATLGVARDWSLVPMQVDTNDLEMLQLLWQIMHMELNISVNGVVTPIAPSRPSTIAAVNRHAYSLITRHVLPLSVIEFRPPKPEFVPFPPVMSETGEFAPGIIANAELAVKLMGTSYGYVRTGPPMDVSRSTDPLTKTLEAVLGMDENAFNLADGVPAEVAAHHISFMAAALARFEGVPSKHRCVPEGMGVHKLGELGMPFHPIFFTFVGFDASPTGGRLVTSQTRARVPSCRASGPSGEGGIQGRFFPGLPIALAMHLAASMGLMPMLGACQLLLCSPDAMKFLLTDHKDLIQDALEAGEHDVVAKVVVALSQAHSRPESLKLLVDVSGKLATHLMKTLEAQKSMVYNKPKATTPLMALSASGYGDDLDKIIASLSPEMVAGADARRQASEAAVRAHQAMLLGEVVEAVVTANAHEDGN